MLELSRSDIGRVLSEISKSISEADQIVLNWDFPGQGNSDEEIVQYYIERAFVQLTCLLEVLQLKQTLARVQEMQGSASNNYARTDHYEDLYTYWGAKLRTFVESIQSLIEESGGTVTKDLMQILRSTQYFVTNTRCFNSPPDSEVEVHQRVEAVLKCIFPDLLHKPGISKSIKHFVPDTGLPSLRTLIEYKYVANMLDIGPIADQVLADTRGYTSKEWDRFIYVIYETERFRSESEWKRLLFQSEVGGNTEIIVICGEKSSKQESTTKSNFGCRQPPR